jgi:hypothetical protein
MVNVPIPIVNDVTKNKFSSLVDIMHSKSKEQQILKSKFINLLKANVGIKKISSKIDSFYEYDFKTFLRELNKQKIELSLDKQSEWNEFFEQKKKEINKLLNEILKTNNDIDQMVYQLYGLTEEEINIVEECL